MNYKDYDKILGDDKDEIWFIEYYLKKRIQGKQLNTFLINIQYGNFHL